MDKKEESKLFARAARMLKSVAHPVRIEIINHLIKEKRLSVNDLKDRLGISQSMTSQHLAVLKHTGVLDCDKENNTCLYYIQNKNVLKLIDCVERCAKEHV